ncbi:MAG: DUF1214 domain-containing protein [Proteobacteria bacterium]|nr:DUF1214 domain-containing protein [Pseudomonadota bacterium]
MDGQPLPGKNRYRIHFDIGKTPHVDAFWSLTIYDKNGYLTNNTIKQKGDVAALHAMTTTKAITLFLCEHRGQTRDKAPEFSSWLDNRFL